MIGVEVTPLFFQTAIGAVTLSLKSGYQRALDIQVWLLSNPPAGSPLKDPLTVEPFSYTPAEAATIRSAFSDLAYQKLNAFDTSLFVKQLQGLGSNHGG